MIPIDRVGQWSQNKLDILAKYLRAYAIILNKQKKKWLKAFHYIDAFAGAGLLLRRDGELDEEVAAYLEGSPLRAIECEPPFDHLWFVEQNRDRRSSLERLIEERCAKHRATVLAGDSNKEIKDIIAKLDSNERGLVFLDPYGLQAEWDTVTALANAHKFDVFINFSIMGVIRNLKRSGEPTQAFRQTLAKVMGSDRWVNDIYTKHGHLFNGSTSLRNEIEPRKIAQIYSNQLKEVFPYVSDYVIMRNSIGAPIYALVLASHNETAIKIMNDIMRKFSS